MLTVEGDYWNVPISLPTHGTLLRRPIGIRSLDRDGGVFGHGTTRFRLRLQCSTCIRHIFDSKIRHRLTQPHTLHQRYTRSFLNPFPEANCEGLLTSANRADVALSQVPDVQIKFFTFHHVGEASADKPS